MKKKLLSAALAVVMVLSMVPGAFAAEAVTANPTNDKLTVNGVPQTPTVYKIGSSNYFKIRDVAAVLNGTDKQFSVGYSGGKVTVTTGQPYEATGKELSGAPASAREATRSNDAILVNGQEASLTVYKIGGSNYFKLRDLGKALGFDVDWTAAQGMMITTGGDAQTTTPPAGTVAYYKDHPNVPDFGIFSGTPLARGMDRGNGYAYLYDVSKVPSGTDIIKPYGDLLMEKGYQYVGSQEYNEGRLVNFSKGQETVNFGFMALDDGGYYVVEILQETTLTPGTVAYYKDYPTVPDFGAYLGIPCNNVYTDTKGDQHYEGGTLYDYDIDKVQAKLPSLHDGYTDLLKQSGFQYGTTYTADDGNSREIYSNGSIELEIGAAETGKDAYYSVIVMVRKPDFSTTVEDSVLIECAYQDFQNVKRQYPHATPINATASAYTNQDGERCVVTHVWFKIESVWDVLTLHNLDTGRVIEDPVNYYKSIASHATGAAKIRLLTTQNEILAHSNNGLTITAEQLDP